MDAIPRGGVHTAGPELAWQSPLKPRNAEYPGGENCRTVCKSVNAKLFLAAFSTGLTIVTIRGELRTASEAF